MAISLVALNVNASIVDYYITKYAAKPMEQMQNLTTQYALGMRRLEEKEERERAEQARASGANEPGEQQCAEKVKSNKLDENEKRSWRVLVSLQHSANRSKMISSTECALYVHTEQQHWTSHNEVPIFTSRPLYVLFECQRLLSGSKHVIQRPSNQLDFSVVAYRRIKPAPDGDASESSVNNDPHGIPNVGNTCYMNALLQCCRQLLMRVPSHLLPESQECPLACALKNQFLTEDDVRRWQCWTFLTIGKQQDICEILEMCLDPKSAMHTSCTDDMCYGALLQRLTQHTLKRKLRCTHCTCLLYTSPSPRDGLLSRMPSSA